MTEHRVIKATFSEWKMVKTRSSLQLIFEVPLEQQGEVLAMLGVPMPGSETWCAIARLQDGKEVVPDRRQPEALADNAQPRSPSEGGAKPRSRAQMAGWLCNERSFQLFLAAHSGDPVADEATAAWTVRKWCMVESRSVLDSDTDAGFRWDELLSAYRRWQLEPSCGVPAS